MSPSVLDYEAERHISEIEQGKTLTSETRNYNVQQGSVLTLDVCVLSPTCRRTSFSITVSMRTKEKDVDYRFMPEPDIPPLHVSAAQVSGWWLQHQSSFLCPSIHVFEAFFTYDG